MANKNRYCVICGFVGAPKTVTRGSLFVEIILWLFFLVPGMIYSTWRLSSRFPACRHCGSRDIIPVDSPRAKALNR